MGQPKFDAFQELANNLNLDVSEKILRRCYSLLESGMSAENLIILYDEIRNEFDE
jgi:hypothetical protein